MDPHFSPFFISIKSQLSSWNVFMSHTNRDVSFPIAHLTLISSLFLISIITKSFLLRTLPDEGWKSVPTLSNPPLFTHNSSTSILTNRLLIVSPSWSCSHLKITQTIEVAQKSDRVSLTCLICSALCPTSPTCSNSYRSNFWKQRMDGYSVGGRSPSIRDKLSTKERQRADGKIREKP